MRLDLRKQLPAAAWTGWRGARDPEIGCAAIRRQRQPGRLLRSTMRVTLRNLLLKKSRGIDGSSSDYSVSQVYLLVGKSLVNFPLEINKNTPVLVKLRGAFVCSRPETLISPFPSLLFSPSPCPLVSSVPDYLTGPYRSPTTACPAGLRQNSTNAFVSPWGSPAATRYNGRVR